MTSRNSSRRAREAGAWSAIATRPCSAISPSRWYIAPALARSPLVNPPPAVLSQLRNFRALSDAEDASFTRIFLDAIGG